ncbi:MAG: hypothetical protein WD273_11350 [Trueperaceae bacterium]
MSQIPGVSDTAMVHGGVSFLAPLDAIYWANLGLNTAHRVLLRLREFPAHTFSMLFDQVNRVDWELWLPDGGSFSVRVSAKESRLNMKKRLEETCGLAIQQRLSACGANATYDHDSMVEITVRIVNNRAVLSLNTSGPNLYKRGYKPYSVVAPIRETLAAGILLAIGHHHFDVIVDPFCGSGTFVLEAARITSGKPAGGDRQFTFMQLPFFNESKFKRIRSSFTKRLPVGKYFGFDISGRSIQAARMNAEKAQLTGVVVFEESDVRTVDFNQLGAREQRRLVVTNPPYGRRVATSGLSEKQALNTLVDKLSGWTLAFVSPDRSLYNKSLNTKLAGVAMKSRALAFSNGGIQTYLYVAEIP